MLESSRLNRFRHAQTDSETLRKIWIFDPESTGFCLGIDGILTRIRHGPAVGPAVGPAAGRNFGGSVLQFGSSRLLGAWPRMLGPCSEILEKLLRNAGAWLCLTSKFGAFDKQLGLGTGC